MPSTKNASFRYRVLNDCFRSIKGKYTLEELISIVSNKLDEHFGIAKGISKRQIQEDLMIMKSLPPRGFEAPIECKNSMYYYTDRSFSINQNPLNQDDIGNLTDAIGLLKQFNGLPHFSDLTQTINKLEGSLRANSFSKRTFIDFEKNEKVMGTGHLSPLIKFISERKVIEISYKSFKSAKASEITVHPYLLKEYRNRWFLLAWNDELKVMSNFGLDRIQSIKILPKKAFIENQDFDAENYFENIIGVSIPQNSKIEKIEVQCSAELSDYIKTKPIHSSQKVLKDNKTGILIQLKLIPNYELMSLLLSFGAGIKVLKPETLVSNIKNILKSSLEKY